MFILAPIRWCVLLLCALLLPGCIPHTDRIPLSDLGLQADTLYGFEREMTIGPWQNHGEPNLSANASINTVYRGDRPKEGSSNDRTLSPDARFQPEQAYVYNFISSHAYYVRGTLIENNVRTDDVLLGWYGYRYLSKSDGAADAPPNQPGSLCFDRTTIMLPAESAGCDGNNNAQAIFRFTNVSDAPVAPTVYSRYGRKALNPVPPGGRGAVYYDLPSVHDTPIPLDKVRVETGNPQETRELIIDLRHHDWYQPPEKR